MTSVSHIPLIVLLIPPALSPFRNHSVLRRLSKKPHSSAVDAQSEHIADI